MLKRIFCFLIVIVICLSLLTVSVNAKISAPTNTLKTNGNGGKTDVGMWYITYNTRGIFSNNMGSGYPIRYKMLLPDGTYGILDSANVEHIDFQIKTLAEAKVDFILFDLTNGGLFPGKDGKIQWNWMVENAMLACERMSKWNDSHDWKLRYAVAVGCYQAIRDGRSIGECAELQAEGVYKTFLTNETFGDDHYKVDGKPLLILHDWGENVLTVPHGWNNYKGDRTYGDKFFVRNGQGGEKGTYGWHTRNGTIVDDEVELLCPGQRIAGGSKANVPRDNGNAYLTGWEVVLNNPLPRIVMIASFNDYCEQTGVWTADSSKCKGEYDEQWTDSTGEINNSMYWDMTVEGIKLVRTFNGEIKGDWKSEWFNLGNGRPVRVSNKKPDSSEPTNTEVDDKSDNEVDDKSDNEDKPEGTTSKTDKNTKSSISTVIIIVVVVTAVVVSIGVAVIFILLNKNKKIKAENNNET